jgi:tetratricopeptide (TPR) repeat protein
VPLVLAAIASVIVLIPFAADVRLHFAENDDRDGDLAAAVGGYDQAIAWRPYEAAYRRSGGFAAERLGASTEDRTDKKQRYVDAIRRYEEALDRQPGYVPFLVDLARVHTRRAQEVDPRSFAEADQALAEAVRRDPHDWELRELRGTLLNTWANAGGDRSVRAGAAREFEALLDLQPRRFDAWITLGRIRLALGDADGARAASLEASLILPFTQEAYDIVQAADELDRAG